MIGVALDDRFSCAHAYGWAVAGFWRVFSLAVNLLRHRIVDVRSESILNRDKVWLMAVGGELNLIGESRFQLMHEVEGATRVTLSDEPARYKLFIVINRF